MITKRIGILRTIDHKIVNEFEQKFKARMRFNKDIDEREPKGSFYPDMDRLYRDFKQFEESYAKQRRVED